MDIDRLFRAMMEQEASDLFLKVGTHPFLRIHGRLLPAGQKPLAQEELLELAATLMGPNRRQGFEAEREANFAFDRPGIGRFRVNVLWQQGTVAMVIRKVQNRIPTFEELHLPVEVLTRLAGEKHGLVLVTGPTDSGKSTTVSSILEYLNQHVPRHIVTLEDPVEHQFKEALSIINQREVGQDTRSFSEGLRNVLRQSPDVLYISDIRDQETMEAALLASEAGQLVLSCMHTTNAVTTIERIVALFPVHQHALIRLRLSLALRGIISIRLVKRSDHTGRLPVCEILIATPAVRETLHEGKTDQIPGLIRNGAMAGMQTLTQALYQRYRQGEVDLEEALHYADSPEELQLAIREIRSIRDA